MNDYGQQYFLLREAEEFDHRSTRLLWDERRRALMLAQNQALRLPAGDSTAAMTAWNNATALVFDQFEQQGRIAGSGNLLEYNSGRGFLPLVDGQLQPVDTPAGDFTDIAVGGDGRLAAGYSNGSDTHGVVVFHLSKRWQVAVDQLPAPPRRVLVDDDNKTWCVTAGQLFCCEGEPLPHTYVAQKDRFEPQTKNPHPLRIVHDEDLPADHEALAIASDGDTLFILLHDGAGNQIIATRSTTPAVSETRVYSIANSGDNAVPFAIDIGVVAPGRLALLAPRETGDTAFVQRDCPIVQLHWDTDSQNGSTQLIGERYPMLSQAIPRFVSSADRVLRYQAAIDVDDQTALDAGFDVFPRALRPLQRPRYHTAVRATLTNEMDSGQPDTVWHRVYLEGCIPPGCRFTLYAKAYNNPDDRTSTPFIQQPQWHWCNHRSDRAFGDGLVDAKPGESGLFELLLQRNTGPVRRLQGRHLQLRILLESDGHHSPAIHALKVVFPRFSYQEAYLPQHFHQENNVDPTLDGQPANGADLRERLLAAFEGVLTPVETQIAGADVLLDPDHTPSEHLPWLGELVGQTTPTHWPTHRRRRWLAATGQLQRWRGTLAGVNLALDILTDGAVARGQVVLVENFRLRRNMATILGLDMDDADHPLTLGTGMSGNSIVGDSLILSDADSREFLALFSPELATTQEAEVVEAFFERYAHQVSVLLHGSAQQHKHTVETALEQQMPAHLEWQLIETDHPFVLGLAPLLGVDTFLEKQPPPKRVTLDDTYLGYEGLLHNPAALSPQDVNRREM